MPRGVPLAVGRGRKRGAQQRPHQNSDGEFQPGASKKAKLSRGGGKAGGASRRGGRPETASTASQRGRFQKTAAGVDQSTVEDETTEGSNTVNAMVVIDLDASDDEKPTSATTTATKVHAAQNMDSGPATPATRDKPKTNVVLRTLPPHSERNEFPYFKDGDLFLIFDENDPRHQYRLHHDTLVKVLPGFQTANWENREYNSILKAQAVGSNAVYYTLHPTDFWKLQQVVSIPKLQDKFVIFPN
jgi:hypothetical protein